MNVLFLDKFRISNVRSTRRSTYSSGSTSDVVELSVPNDVLIKFRKSCAAYCTAGFVIGLGKIFILSLLD